MLSISKRSQEEVRGGKTVPLEATGKGQKRGTAASEDHGKMTMKESRDGGKKVERCHFNRF